MPKQSTNSAGSAASGAPKFFIPGGVTNASAKENSFAPTWGAVASAQPASPVPQSALPQHQATHFAPTSSPGQPASSYFRFETYTNWLRFSRAAFAKGLSTHWICRSTL